jgi:hypothetical protein
MEDKERKNCQKNNKRDNYQYDERNIVVKKNPERKEKDDKFVVLKEAMVDRS